MTNYVTHDDLKEQLAPIQATLDAHEKTLKALNFDAKDLHDGIDEILKNQRAFSSELDKNSRKIQRFGNIKTWAFGGVVAACSTIGSAFGPSITPIIQHFLGL